MSLIENLKLIWTGKASKPLFVKYMLFWFAFYIVFAFISALCYSVPYSMNTEYVSFLGSPEDGRNPAGYWIYNVAVFIAGFALVPHFVYIYRSLRATMGPQQLAVADPNSNKSKLFKYYSKFMDKQFPAFACFLGIVGYIGFALIGVFYQKAGGFGNAINIWHKVATFMAFGGLGAAAVFLMFVFMRRMHLKASWPKVWQFLIMYGVCIGLVVIALTLVNGVMSEWLFLIIILIWLVLSGLFYDPGPQK